MDYLTLIFFVVAVLIFLRLRNLLGQRNGTERPPQERQWPVNLKPAEKQAGWSKAEKKQLDASAPVKTDMPAENRLEGVKPGSPAATPLQSLIDADPAFRVPHFLHGAKIAYEMIVTAFAKGDRTALRKLLASEIYETFEQDIMAREKRGETVELHFVGIDKADIAEAALEDDHAQITVYFVSKLVQVTRGKTGEIIEGDATNVTEVSDRWTFERKIASADPNWKLAAAEDA